ncbi:MAG: hypothetical protein DMG97_25520 [Acidobacteria bacterium]|nr:MAG: hypothetical protein DMG97_25520 [Acidobacteriota bacterium]
MKYAVVLTVIFLVGSVIVFAQLPPQASSAGMLGEAPSAAMPGTARMLLLNGKVTTEANSPPPESVNISLVCGNREEIAHAHSDTRIPTPKGTSVLARRHPTTIRRPTRRK